MSRIVSELSSGRVRKATWAAVAMRSGRAHALLEAVRRAAPALAVLLAAALATAPAVAGEALRVVATIKPIHGLVAAVMEGVATPGLLMSGNASPHTFSMRPSEARALHDAHVVFRVSPALEPFTVRIANSLPETVAVVSLADAPGLKRLEQRSGGPFETHSHGSGDKGHRADAHARHGHSHGHDQSGVRAKVKSAGVAAIDPHVWLDPENAKAMTAMIVSVLSAKAPEHAARFAHNARRLTDDLDALSREIATVLAPARGTALIVFHDAYQYLEQRYGLTVVGSITVNPEIPPSAGRIKELRERIARLNAGCVLSEPQFEPRIVASVVEGSKARGGVIDPVGGLLPPGNDHYQRTMRAIASAIAGCLAKA